MSKTHRSKIPLLVLPLTLLAAPLAWAEATLEEVVVTAERRAENLQDVPISVNAFPAAEVERQRIQEFQDLAVAIPGFSVNTFTKSRLSPSLRGGSSSLAGAGAEGAVGLFIDDQYYGGPGDFEIDLWDVERIEVLRGPQGTLFGRNTTGGSINVITKNPSLDETEAKAELTFGNYNLIQGRALVSAPLNDKWAGMISIQNTSRNGTSFNRTTGNDVDNINKSSIRGKLLWESSDTLRTIFSASVTTHDETGIARDQINFPLPVDNSQLTSADFELNDPRTTTQFTDGRYQSEQYTLGMRIEKDVDAGQFLSITSLRDFDSNHAPSSLTGAPIPVFYFGEPREVTTISQEFRFTSDSDGPFNYVAGAYFYNSDEERIVNATVNWDVEAFAGLIQAQVFCPDPAQADATVVLPSCRGPGLITVGNQTVSLDSLYQPSDYRIDDNVETTSVSVFAEGKYDLSDTFTATLGVRWTEDEKTLNGGVEGAPDFVWNGVPGSVYQNSEKWDEVTYRVVLDWKVTENALLYASNATGFRSGAYDVTTSDPVLAQEALDPETVDSFEVGFKSRWVNDRVQLNLTYFDVTYEDLQFFVTVPSAAGVITANAGEASVDGIEAEFIAALTDNLIFNLQYVNQSGTSQDIPEDAEVPPGTPPQGTVPNTYIASLQYDTDTTNGGHISASVDFTHKDEYNLEFSDAANFLTKTDALVNARFSYEFPGDHWTMTIWGKNLTDEDIITYGQDFSFPFYNDASFGARPEVSDAVQPRYTDPLTVGITVGYEF